MSGTVELWRTEPDVSDRCWSPNPLLALSFGSVGGSLVRAVLDVDHVTVRRCRGVGEWRGGWPFPADGAAFRERHAAEGVDWLTYDDIGGFALASSGDQFIYGDPSDLGLPDLDRLCFGFAEGGRQWELLRLRDVAWCVLSARGRGAIFETARWKLPKQFAFTREEGVRSA